ncbi:hypothetical protein [Alkalihalophilus marmarensis]|uniref:Uncharacterized protein n=1 Tax=Alkalihalophilus marmarensis DSM 21297 TaxID=1188261 RepID=U6SMN8_9BACI|nr:hypothetical protein [Alkalihalophilus marmarensis]ERN52838.1 hypothetical protein A33I_14195 [Alkalihalophilus marmarensis DSM 21297]
MVGFIFKFSLFIFPFLIFFYVVPDYQKIQNLNDVLLGSIALGSASVGFFIAGISILQTSNVSRFYSHLVELQTNKKIIAWLMTAIIYMFLLSVMSLVVLFFLGSGLGWVTLLLHIWLASLVASILSTFLVILYFSFVFLFY